METIGKSLDRSSLITKISCFFAMVLILAAVLAGNIVAGIYSDLITEFFHGAGVDTSSEEAQEAFELSDALCRDIAEEGIVLVKNENNALPLKADEAERVNIFGWGASDGGWIYGSDGSANSNSGTSRAKVHMLTRALTDAGMAYNTELMSMYTAFRNQRAGVRALTGKMRFYMLIEPGVDAYSAIGEGGNTILQNAKIFSDTAIVVLGRMGGEGTDLPFVQYRNTTGKYTVDSTDMPEDTTRTYLDVSIDEEALLEMVTANFDKVIVLVNTCNAMNLGYLENYDIDAALWVNGMGQSGSHAIPKVLKGDVNPSGRMTNIQPYDLSTDPTFANAGGKSASKNYITYAEDIYVGYKWYETADEEGLWSGKTRTVKEFGTSNTITKTGYDAVVQYPFGHGLSYTKFDWNIESITPAPGSDLALDSQISVKVRVTNTGSVDGKEVVQCYFTPPYKEGGIEKAHVNLVAFAKTTTLEPGKSEVLDLKFTSYDMASYDCYDKNTNRNVGYEMDWGKYTISIRTNSHDVKTHNGEPLSFDYDVLKTLRFTTDPITENRVTNHFTTYSVVTKQQDGSFATEVVNAYGNCAIDGSDANGADVVYLTRSDFKNTFPSETLGGRTGTAVTNLRNYNYNGYSDITQMPVTDTVDGERLLLYVTESGGQPNVEQLKTGKDLKINHDLVMELGGDYDSPKWERLINQMSKTELSDLVELGGYRTYHIASIGKKYMLENDGPSGLNRHMNAADGDQNPDRATWTMFPNPTVIANSFNWTMAYAYGLSIGNEGMETGVTGWYAPGANMQRSPFGGRNCEYYSEDAFLSGVMAAETSRGAINNGMNVYVKHYAVNETETNRSGLNTWLTEQTLREIYLRPFEIAVKRGGANGLMSSFNMLGSIWTGANHALMTDILRDEWGFRGAVVTDYYHSDIMPLDRGLVAGNDLWLTGGGNKTGKTFYNDSASFIYCAQRSAKNILFARCNSYYTANTHDSSEDVIVSNVQKMVTREDPFPAWIFIVVGIDVVTVAGVLVWTFFLLKKRKIVTV